MVRTRRQQLQVWHIVAPMLEGVLSREDFVAAEAVSKTHKDAFRGAHSRLVMGLPPNWTEGGPNTWPCTFTVDVSAGSKWLEFHATVETPGGTKFAVRWRERGHGLDWVSMQENYPDDSEYESSEEFTNGLDSDGFRAFREKRRGRAVATAEEYFAEKPFVMMLTGPNLGCDGDCCATEVVTRGADFNAFTPRGMPYHKIS